jgi:hypothetical protein
MCRRDGAIRVGYSCPTCPARVHVQHCRRSRFPFPVGPHVHGPENLAFVRIRAGAGAAEVVGNSTSTQWRGQARTRDGARSKQDAVQARAFKVARRRLPGPKGKAPQSSKLGRGRGAHRLDCFNLAPWSASTIVPKGRLASVGCGFIGCVPFYPTLATLA